MVKFFGDKLIAFCKYFLATNGYHSFSNAAFPAQKTTELLFLLFSLALILLTI